MANCAWSLAISLYIFDVQPLGTLHQALEENDISEIGSLDYANYQVAVKNSLTYAWASNDDVWNGAIDQMVLNSLKKQSIITQLNVCDDAGFIFETATTNNKKISNHISGCLQDFFNEQMM